MLRRSEQKEILDGAVSREQVLVSMRRLAWQNKWFFNNWLVYYFANKFVVRTKSVSILDVGTGVADLPHYLQNKFITKGLQVSATGVDTNSTVLDIARRNLGVPLSVRLVNGRLEELNEKFDIVTASQMLHHVSPEDVPNFLKALYEKARVGVIISDLVRSRLNYWLVKFFMYAVFADKISKNDGPISILRAYTDAELKEFFKQAGIENFKTYSFLFRKIIVIKK